MKSVVRSFLGLLVAFAGCADPGVFVPTDRETVLDPGAGSGTGSGASVAIASVECRISMAVRAVRCGEPPEAPAGSVSGVAAAGHATIGGQHRYVRLVDDATNGDLEGTVDPVDGQYRIVEFGVTVQNLTLQPWGTRDGTALESNGVRVVFTWFSDPRIEVLADGEAPITSSTPQPYYRYAEVLAPGATSASKTWSFRVPVDLMDEPGDEWGFRVLVRMTKLTMGEWHACGLDDRGRAYCWGHGGDGRLGNGTAEDRRLPTPVDMSPLPAGRYFVDISAAAAATCAIDDGGDAWCWGDNSVGQLGNGQSGGSSSVPVKVTRPTFAGQDVTFERIDGGRDHFCAVGSNPANPSYLPREYRVWCWGSNAYGKLGRGSAVSFSSTPDYVGSTSFYGGNMHVSAGFEHACAIMYREEVIFGDRIQYWWPYCWGLGDGGRLGNGDTGGWAVAPAAVSGNIYTSVIAAADQTCAIRWSQDAPSSDGLAYCWGPSSGGTNGSSGDRSQPAAVPGDTKFASISAGVLVTCGIGRGDGKLYCWGNGGRGRRGDGVEDAGSSVTSPAPVDVSWIEAMLGETLYFEEVHSWNATCARSTRGQVVCWGPNGADGDVHYTLGDGTDAPHRTVPVFVGGVRAMDGP